MTNSPNDCISASEGKSWNGNNIQIWDCHSGAAFEFEVDAGS
jgi:hypothetical protein